MHAPDPGFWLGKRVLLTGHTGFKGAWLTIWLHRLGAEVTGVSLLPLTEPSLFDLARVEELCDSRICDIRQRAALAGHIREARPEIVIHLAAQPLVRASYGEPVETFSTNVMGTAHVLDALRGLDSVRVAAMITTDKVYRNNEWMWPYRECDELGGHDPYSASKAASELVIASYRDSFLRDQGVALASARAGNVIGGGDWSEDRLIPDAIRAWQEGQVLRVRRPQAIRPWQHVLEPLSGYLALAQELWKLPELIGAYNFGPDPMDAVSVKEVVELASAAYDDAPVDYLGEADELHEAGLLALDTSKARASLGYRPRWKLAHAVHRTISWYLALRDGAEARALCLSDISDYEADSCADSP